MRKRTPKILIICTEEACQNCNHKIKRIFQDDYYIYKSGSTCEVCPGIAITTAIYGEYRAGKRSGG